MADFMSSLFAHQAETDGLTVRVSVAFLADQSSPEAGRWFWSYHIRIENHRATAVQLLARHWLISDAKGRLHEVRGPGVVGDMPRIEAGDSYDYVSGCPLETSSGAMRGEFHMVDEAGSTFDIAIPPFTLEAPRG
jgi:ApaG protein